MTSILDDLGDQLSFSVRAIAWVPRTARRYRTEVARLLAEVAFGSGALVVILGTAGVMLSLSLFVGSLVGLQGFRALDSLGVQALTGFITAYFNTRDIAPLVPPPPSPPRWARASPPSSARCGSPRRSTRWR
jgi:phospholipid/cholesterol/gamma-HCH transport system permease protein